MNRSDFKYELSSEEEDENYDRGEQDTDFKAGPDDNKMDEETSNEGEQSQGTQTKQDKKAAQDQNTDPNEAPL